MYKPTYLSPLVSLLLMVLAFAPAYADEPDIGVMDNKRLGELIYHLDNDAQGQPGYWSLVIENVGLQVITDENANRMRIISPIIKASVLDEEQLYRLMQANFDTALDVRYAIANGILWSTYIHPLESLSDEDFLTALGQTVNTVVTYGSSYSSGLLNYRGGDSQDLLRKDLIEQLRKKGKEV